MTEAFLFLIYAMVCAICFHVNPNKKKQDAVYTLLMFVSSWGYALYVFIKWVAA